MNFLAHLYLSGNNQELMIGNFIADHIKGNTMSHLPESVRKGILLHRKIDDFTDHHALVSHSKQRIRPVVGKYAPVVIDIFYDHFLAANWKDYSEKTLEAFASDFYKLTGQLTHLLPERTRYMLRHMIPGNWLVAYAELPGIQGVLEGMAQRARFVSGMERAAAGLKKDYTNYRNEFTPFFEELREFVRTES